MTESHNKGGQESVHSAEGGGDRQIAGAALSPMLAEMVNFRIRKRPCLKKEG